MLHSVSDSLSLVSFFFITGQFRRLLQVLKVHILCGSCFVFVEKWIHVSLDDVNWNRKRVLNSSRKSH